MISCGFPDDRNGYLIARRITKNSRRISEFAENVTEASSVGGDYDISKIRLNQIDLVASNIKIKMFRTTEVFPKNIIVQQLFGGDESYYQTWMTDQCAELAKFKNVFKWYKSKYKKTVNELTVFQPMYQLFGERMLHSLSEDFSIEEANGENMLVNIFLRKNMESLVINGTTDLAVSANGHDTSVELKSPFSKNKGMYH